MRKASPAVAAGRSAARRGALLGAALLAAPGVSLAAETEHVPAFGLNPGALLMYRYVPDVPPAGMPLVVALHGCSQDAQGFDDESGWADLADGGKFALLLPEQPASNNPDRCFSFFSEDDNRRGSGEAASIAAMIETILADEELRLDRSRVFITGLSAGGGMAVAMLAAYPELFAGGAIVAGVPYGCASTFGNPWLAMQRWWFLMTNPFGEAGWAAWRCGIARHGFANPGATEASSEEWRERVAEAAGDPAAPQSRITLWQGDADETVDPANLGELVKQWTAVHGIDAMPDGETAEGGMLIRSYADSAGSVRVESVEIGGLGHALPVDPGSGPDACGVAGPYLDDRNICAARRIAEFWGLAFR
jgi:poly(3-hydroxybutyrate) depolymerase